MPTPRRWAAKSQGMTAQDYFLNGFSSVLSGRSVFKVDATVAGEPVTGFILLDMEMGDSIAINELKVQLGGLALAYEGDALYVQYKDLTGKLAVSDITSLLGGLLGGAESGSEEGGGLNTDELLGALLGGELTETDTTATLTSTLPLGSLQIPVEFGFDVTETESGKQVAWSYHRRFSGSGGHGDRAERDARGGDGRQFRGDRHG